MRATAAPRHDDLAAIGPGLFGSVRWGALGHGRRRRGIISVPALIYAAGWNIEEEEEAAASFVVIFYRRSVEHTAQHQGREPPRLEDRSAPLGRDRSAALDRGGDQPRRTGRSRQDRLRRTPPRPRLPDSGTESLGPYVHTAQTSLRARPSRRGRDRGSLRPRGSRRRGSDSSPARSGPRTSPEGRCRHELGRRSVHQRRRRSRLHRERLPPILGFAATDRRAVLGAWFGVRLRDHTPDAPLQVGFAVYMVIVAAQLFIDATNIL